MSKDLAECAKLRGQSPAFPDNEPESGMSYREWLEGLIVAQLAVRVSAGECGATEAACVASNLASAMLYNQAWNAAPKVVCDVCRKTSLTNPCVDCADTLNDEPTIRLCPDCGKPEQPFDENSGCTNSVHIPF